VTWRVEAAHRFGQVVGHALRRQIKRAAALLRSAAAASVGLPMNLATIWLIA
jgi:hypothetical protein